ncbi:MAG: hypothetical protein WAO02_03985 [Verrucomicrobiia bacterium]
MKTKLTRLTTALALLVLAALILQPSTIHAQGTAFTYQGRLNAGGGPANGNYDLTFTLFSVGSGGGAVAGPVTNSATGVTNGLFTATLDFGSGVFNGTGYWLQIGVRTNGTGSFSTLTPRQPVTPSPYAIYSENSGGVNNSSISAPQLNTVGSPASGQVLTFNGSSLVWTNPTAGGGVWSLTGNGGTTPGVNFLGTSDNEPLELWVNGGRAFRLQPGLNDPDVIGGTQSSIDPSVSGATIAGGVGNTIGAGNDYATIGGGSDNTAYYDATVSGGYANRATNNEAVVGGGYNNTAGGKEATVSGGAQNTATGPGGFVGGGGYDGINVAGNKASGPASTVTGGTGNTASGEYAIIGGGANNAASSEGAFVGGGLDNTASGELATVPGGSLNLASGQYSFAAGDYAQAINEGAFVWADSEGTPFSSTANNQFSVRANGGVRFVTGGMGMTIDGVPVATGGGGGGGSGWSLTGNAGTTPGVNFLGTTDDAGLELHVYSLRGIGLNYSSQGPLGINNATDASINVNSGFWENLISAGVVGATIAGGGEQHYDDLTGAQNMPNSVTGNFGTVGGGNNNTAGYGGTVPGGIDNTASGQSSFAAGENATASDNNSFVWSDGTRGAVSQGPNSFAVLATGGAFFYTTTSSLNVEVDPAGDVDFGSSTRQMLNLYSSLYGIGVQSSTLYQRTAAGGGFAWFAGGVHTNAQDNPGGGTTVMTLDGSGNLNVTANASVCTLAIRGGCDLAEPFQISSAAQEIPQGAVVVIDEANPGQLRMSDQPYDTRVAGIISGANGINPGIQMQQQGLLEGGKNVALTGRVYVQADTSNGAIKAGDLLTTSSIAGHAMKVTDHARAQGATLGKAMSALKDGQGMILVLVTLQ